MLEFHVVLHTSGNGLWSNVQTSVQCVSLDLCYVNEEKDFGELKVYFELDEWPVMQNGLIYTDPLFLEQLQEMMAHRGLDSLAVEYSEQGMQGINYVSFDVDEAFINSWFQVKK